MRKKPKLDNEAEATPAPIQQSLQPSSDTSSQYSPRIDQSPAPQQPFQPRYEGQQDLGGPIFPWRHPILASGSNLETVSNPRLGEHAIVSLN